MLWICLTAWAGLFIWYFRMRKKAEDHKLVETDFPACSDRFIAALHSAFRSECEKFQEMKKRNFNWNGVP